MNKSELISEVAKEAQMQENDVAKILDYFIQTVKEKLLSGEKVEISGFGSFILSRHKEQTFVNPKTKQVHDLPERFLPKFKPVKDLKK